MAGIKAYLAFLIGCALTFGGGYMSFSSIGSMSSVMLWGTVAVVGVFPLAQGISGIISGFGESDDDDERTAPPKTDAGSRRR